MNVLGQDLYDSSSVLSNWENEGGARAAVADDASRYASDDILRSFGESVVAHWNELPHGFKQVVFQEILRTNCRNCVSDYALLTASSNKSRVLRPSDSFKTLTAAKCGLVGTCRKARPTF